MGQSASPFVTSKIYDLQIRNFAQTFTNYRGIKNDKKNLDDVIRNLMTSQNGTHGGIWENFSLTKNINFMYEI